MLWGIDGLHEFPISRDPPEGGTPRISPGCLEGEGVSSFPISRDPPEGGTLWVLR